MSTIAPPLFTPSMASVTFRRGRMPTQRKPHWNADENVRIGERLDGFCYITRRNEDDMERMPYRFLAQALDIDPRALRTEDGVIDAGGQIGPSLQHVVPSLARIIHECRRGG